MSSVVFSAAARAARSGVSRAQTGVRKFSADAFHAEHEATMKTWEKVSYGTIPVIVFLGAVNMYLQASGEHGHTDRKYEYLNIYKKPFPWSCHSKLIYKVQGLLV
mmetsp:Transcript_10440/g.19519  ORF Transcript_10440/g.19519 Transcript_10440/m.19519 type:complete len:105 (+) Transcript_10440:410-724(+)